MTHSTKSAAKPKLNTIAFEAIGTLWTIDVYDASGSIEALQQVILDRIELFDVAYSRFRQDSLVTKISQQARQYQLPPDAAPMFDLYAELYALTNGAMTPLIGQTISDAGYDANYSLKPGKVTAPPQMADIVQYTGTTLTVTEPVLLDFGAMGKGYLVDIISELLADFGLTHFCVNAGGDMHYKTPRNNSLEVGLEHPADRQLAIGVAAIRNQAICGSSGNLRAWGDFHHIIDARTAQSPSHIAGLWVVAETTLLSDALATALFFVPPQVLAQHYTFEYAIVTAEYSLEHSPNFPAEFFTGGNSAA